MILEGEYQVRLIDYTYIYLLTVQIFSSHTSFVYRGLVVLKEYVNTSELSKQDLKHDATGR